VLRLAGEELNELEHELHHEHEQRTSLIVFVFVFAYVFVFVFVFVNKRTHHFAFVCPVVEERL